VLFIILILLAALAIEGIGTLVSIIGLSALFNNNPIIIVMAIALDIGKLVAVSFIYKYWEKINWLMKTYMTVATIVLVFITSVGAFGFLSAEFQKAIAGSNQQIVQIEALAAEQTRLQARKAQIDQQVANLPAHFGRTRINVINAFREEASRIDARLAEIDEELPRLKVENIERSVKVGPIIYIAEAFGTTPEIAVKWVILTIIFVFDPLAVALILAGNFLLIQRELGRAARPAAPNPIAESIRAVNEQLTAGLDALRETVAPTPQPVADAAQLATSSLEQINAARADVAPDTDARHPRMIRHIVDTYQNSDIPAVTVGGPPTRSSK